MEFGGSEGSNLELKRSATPPPFAAIAGVHPEPTATNMSHYRFGAPETHLVSGHLTKSGHLKMRETQPSPCASMNLNAITRGTPSRFSSRLSQTFRKRPGLGVEVQSSPVTSGQKGQNMC